MTSDAEPISEARALLDLLHRGQATTFQTFDESSQKRRELTKVPHGHLDQHHEWLSRLNDEGAGIFFMVNGSDGRGRKTANVTEVRAVFVDLDGAPLQPVLDGPLRPHAVVESSKGRYHAYWAAEGVALSDFETLQSNIAARFGGDRVVKDLPRVMRLPGFLHRKGAPYRTRILSIEAFPPYARGELGDAFGLKLDAPTPRKPQLTALGEVIAEGHRNTTLFNLARGLVNKGFGAEEVSQRIHRVNAERCRPPLCAKEVDALVSSACSHPASGTLNLPLSVFDSEQYRNLSHAARTVAAMAYRRFNGSNNGNISLPFGDFRKEFSRPQSFYDARAEAVRSGLLRVARKRRYHQRGGREPDLYEVVMQPPSVPILERSASN